MKTIYKLLLLLPLCTLLACNDDFLQRPPLDEVTSLHYFKTPNDLKAYVNQFYTNANFPKFNDHGNDFNSDNQVALDPDTRLQGTRTIVTSGTIAFGAVRSINYFFDHYKAVQQNYALDDYKQYLGEAHFFKALIYFDLVKTYGDIQWLSTELGTSSPELYNPRDPREVVADKILASLDTAAMYLTADKTRGSGRINKWMALLVQSRVALFEGTWQKYHAGTPFAAANPQPEKYFNIAAKAASDIMASGLYNIYTTGKPESDYKDLFKLRTYANNPEVMFWREYNNDLSRGESSFTNTRNYYMIAPYGKTITKSLADSYLCADGKPVSVSPLFKGYQDLEAEKSNRDPRFSQTIATPAELWTLQPTGQTQLYRDLYAMLNTSARDNAPSGYVILKGYNPDLKYHVSQYEETPSILFRYAEVLLNYAEAKAELGQLTQADIDMSVKKLRDRAGMPNLVLSGITKDPNWDFPALPDYINEIRRERRVELSLEGFRWDDIARWAAADELIVGKRPRGFKAAQVKINPFPVDANGFLDPYKNAMPDGYGFKPGRDYLNSIPVSELVLNPSLKQNPGWE
ncbi:RagB/SusD family nutrient uptake outer membrane protein [Ravibacter arvi]|uniref:RagB/SusD family nutrient uptake outer membrane protein n=1 Tax=Ravibacter arvi TaxID=2051041 RepID=A0ABP8LYU0_9BACT